jgi:multimeric flavodoxin WrbA
MNVLAINGSPRAQNSGTGRILAALLQGMAEGGAVTELLHVMKLQIKPCTGCYHCWVQTPGRCIHGDGMEPALAPVQACRFRRVRHSCLPTVP